MLAVVEHQQPDPALQRGGHRLAHGLARLLGDAQHRRHRVGHRRRISDRSQFEKPDTVGKFIGQPRRDFGRQAGLADPAHPGQRHQPMSLHRRFTSATSDSRPMKLVVAGRRFPGLVSSARNGGNSVRRPGARTWNTPTGTRHIPQPSRPQIDQVNSAEQHRRRVGHQDLTAMPGGHHPRRAVEHRAEVVPVAQFGLAGRQPHPHRQLQRPLRGDRSIDSGPRRGERGAPHRRRCG